MNPLLNDKLKVENQVCICNLWKHNTNGKWGWWPMWNASQTQVFSLLECLALILTNSTWAHCDVEIGLCYIQCTTKYELHLLKHSFLAGGGGSGKGERGAGELTILMACFMKMLVSVVWWLENRVFCIMFTWWWVMKHLPSSFCAGMYGTYHCFYLYFSTI